MLDGMSNFEIVSLILTSVSMIGMLLLNSKLSSGMDRLRAAFTRELSEATKDFTQELAEATKDFQVKISQVELQVANLSRDIAREQAALYQRITDSLGSRYMDKTVSEQMHRENNARLDRIELDVRQLAEGNSKRIRQLEDEISHRHQ